MPDTTPLPRGERTRTAEKLLLEALPSWSPGSLLCTSLGRGQLGAEAARRWPDQQVTIWWSDLYQSQQAREFQGDDAPPNLNIICQPDPPPGPYDRVAIPLNHTGDAEWAREAIQTGYLALKEGGRLIVAVDNKRDSWLGAELRKLSPKIDKVGTRRGVVYELPREGDLKRIRNYRCEFAFRDQGRLIQAVSRPGVFSHRRLDLGARKLMDAMTLEPGDTVLDLGCGAGTVSLAAALRAEGVRVHAVDSDSRAIQCTQEGAKLNGIETITTELSANGPWEKTNFRVVLANPPYFSHFRIAREFLEIAESRLAPGGELLLVTQSPNWYEEHAPEYFASMRIEPAKKYWVLRATRM